MARFWQYLVSISTLFTSSFLLNLNTDAFAQSITLDGSLGTPGTLTGPNYVIPQAAGQAIGNNLFHSFDKFNLNRNEAATFQSNPNIQNILSRVTGGNQSLIDGLIRTQTGVNLFFINPSGIIFGQNARLDVGGLFVASTANALQFGNLGFFSATEKNVPSALLTINPSALLFNQINPAPIVNNSIAPAGIDPSGFDVFGLRVPDGKSLLLVGGNISMDGGQLNAYGGRVELGGLAAPGNVNLLFNDDNLSLKFPENVTRADVSLNNEAFVYVEAAGGGDIAINARNVDILGGSQLSAGIGRGLGTPETVAGDITLNTTGEIKVAGSGSYIFNNVRQGAKGNGGNITIDSSSFSLRDGARLSALTSGQGNAGNVTVSAKDAVSFAGIAAIFSTVQAGGVGKGGNININAATLSLTDGAQLATITRGASATQPAGRGDAGNVNVTVTGAVDIAGVKNGFGSGIYSFVDTGTVGNGGNITIDSGSFSLRDGAQLVASTSGQGNAGNVTVNAKNAVSLARIAAILSTVEAGGVGKGGNIDINAATLSLTDGGEMQTSTSGASATQPAARGDAGNVNVKVSGAVDIAGVKNGFSSGIFSRVYTGTVGNGGNITIDSGDFSLRDGARLEASTYGQGNAGNVTVNAKDAVSLAGNPYILSTVEAGGVGKGGNIDINAATLSLTDGGQLITITRGASATQPAGRGDAGNVNVTVTGAVNIAGVKNGFGSGIFSRVNTGTVGNGGNITIDSGFFSLRDGAQLEASTYGQGNAGNIRINALDAVTVSGTKQESGFSSGLLTFTNSTSTGKGGDITVNANSFRVSDGALLDASTRNNQKGGNITVNANVFEALNGGQLTTTTESNGRAGKITVNATDKVIISGIDSNYNDRIAKFPDDVVNIGANSGLFVSSTGSGITGDIEINSPKITLDNQGKLNADSASGNGGNINVNSDLLLLRRNSQISTNAGTEQKGGDGGNININSKFIVAVPNENSDISANAFTGSGGKVTINATGIYGITPRSREDLVRLLGTNEPKDLDPAKLPTSDITAISQTSPILNGDVILNTPDLDPSRGLTQLPTNLIDVSQQIAQGCTPKGKTASHFISTGRGGLPLNPDEPLRGRAVITNWVTLGEGNQEIKAELTPQPTPETIVEAQGWVINADGKVQLVASVPGGGGAIQSNSSCGVVTFP